MVQAPVVAKDPADESADEPADGPLEDLASFNDSSSVSWVLVPVVARHNGPRKRPLRKLEREDFRLSVDGREVEVGSFESGDDNPIRLVFLQDLSGSMANAGKLDASRQALELFMADARPGDELSLATFTAAEVTIPVPWTGDVGELRKAAADWQPWGRTALHDAVAFLPRIRASDQSLRRAAILLTDGGDNASELSPTQAREIVRAAELPIYVLDLRLGRPLEAPKPYETSVAQVLQLLAQLTGGRYFAVTDIEALEAAHAAIAEELREQYVLGFATRSAGTAAQHTIELKIPSRRKARLSYRHGYYGHLPTIADR